MIASGWNDVAAVYRPTKNAPTIVIAVPGCEAVPGRRKATSNFDAMKSQAGQSNKDNQETSDSWRCPPGYDIRAGDKLLINGTQWFTVAGQPTIKTVIPRQVAFITTTTRPKIQDGEWSDS